MKFEGGCYCGQVRYVAEGEPMVKGQCHCRECQYITGGCLLARQALVAQRFNAQSESITSLARFFAENILVEAAALERMIADGAASITCADAIFAH